MRSHESDVADGALKALEGGVAYRETRHPDGRAFLPEHEPGERGGRGLQDGNRAWEDAGRLPAWRPALSCHLCTWEWKLEGSREFKVILLSMKENIPTPTYFAEACRKPWPRTPTQKATYVEFLTQEQASVYEFKSGGRKNFIENLRCTCKGLARKLSRELARLSAFRDKG